VVVLPDPSWLGFVTAALAKLRENKILQPTRYETVYANASSNRQEKQLSPYRMHSASLELSVFL
jgi:hypothetical protein